MGEKKIEYKKNFSYITFIFGKPKCRGITPCVEFEECFKKAFGFK